MASWKTFLDYLAANYSGESWDDYACLHAEELLAAFEESDWKLLQKHWPDMPELWQLRCADVLVGVTQQESTELTAQMLEHTLFDSVAFRAADTLRVKLACNPHPVSANAKARVLSLLKSIDGLRRESLRQLTKLLGV